MLDFLTDIAAFRFRNDDGTEATATYDSTLNQTDYSLDVDTTKRLRIVVQETNGGAANNQSFTWQYRHVEGTNTWTNITTSSSVVQAVSSQLVDDADTTTTARIGSGTFITDNNAQCEDGVTTAAAADFLGNDETECELSFQIVGTDVSNGDTIDFRVLIGGVAPTATTNLPTLTAVASVSFSGTTSQTFSAITQASTGTHLKTYTVTVTQTLPSLTQAATATHVPPIFAATVLQTVSAITQVATGAFVPWSATGTISQLLPAVNQSGTGSHSPPVFSGTASQTLSPITQSVTATGAPIFSGVTTQSFSAISQTVTGTLTIPPISGAISQAFSPVVQVVSGTFSAGTSSGTAVQTLPVLSQAVTATLTIPPIFGTISQVLGSISQTVGGAYALNPVAATVEQTLPSFLQSVDATFAAGNNIGTIGQTLPSATLSVTGSFVPVPIVVPDEHPEEQIIWVDPGTPSKIWESKDVVNPVEVWVPELKTTVYR